MLQLPLHTRAIALLETLGISYLLSNFLPCFMEQEMCDNKEAAEELVSKPGAKRESQLIMGKFSANM